MFNAIVFTCLAILVVWLIVFQIAVPLWQGTILFPAFRRDRLAIETEAANLREKKALEAMTGEVEQLKKED